MQNKYTAYITPISDLFVVVDKTSYSSNTYSKTDIIDKVSYLQSEIDAIPADPTDEELLEWARVNYPRIDYSVRRFDLETQLSSNSALLEAINSPVTI